METKVMEHLEETRENQRSQARYMDLREQIPVFYSKAQNAWMVTGYKDVQSILKDYRRFSAERPLTSAPDGLGYSFMLFSQDPPDHTHLRSFAKELFANKNIVGLHDYINLKLSEVLGSVGTRFDFAEEVANRLPVHVLTHMLGVDSDRWWDLKLWTEMVAGHHNNGRSYPGRNAFRMLHTLFRSEIAKRRESPGNDFVSRLLLPSKKGQSLTDLQIINYCTTLLVAGNETSASLISNVLNIVAQSPGLWGALQSDRSLVEPVIEETLRYDSPGQYVGRVSKETTRVGGREIPAGATVICCLGAANRDPEVFPEPNRFIPGRKGNHLAFSHGVHFCLGAALARLEARVVLEGMLNRFAEVRLATPGVRYENIFFRGFKKLELCVTR